MFLPMGVTVTAQVHAASDPVIDAFSGIDTPVAGAGLGGHPEHEAQTALFRCSDAGRTFTGSILHPDGGYTSSIGGG
jgi:hypothetical protein